MLISHGSVSTVVSCSLTKEHHTVVGLYDTAPKQVVAGEHFGPYRWVADGLQMGCIWVAYGLHMVCRPNGLTGSLADKIICPMVVN